MTKSNTDITILDDAAREDIEARATTGHYPSFETTLGERFSLTANEVQDLHDALTNAADDLDSEGLGDTDSCLDARRWAKRLDRLRGGK